MFQFKLKLNTNDTEHFLNDSMLLCSCLVRSVNEVIYSVCVCKRISALRGLGSSII